MKIPIYIPSKGRPNLVRTAALLSGREFYVVVEPQELDDYSNSFNRDNLLVLPFAGQGIAASRNWIKEHARARGLEWHWQIDDDILQLYEETITRRVKVDADLALSYPEELAGEFRNVEAIGIRSCAFSRAAIRNRKAVIDYSVNRQVYTVFLARTASLLRWRQGVVDDTDYSLQILSSGYCTILIERFSHQSALTGSTVGGNGFAVIDDTRVKKIRGLIAAWPGLGIKIQRRARCPLPATIGLWRKFKTMPERKD